FQMVVSSQFQIGTGDAFLTERRGPRNCLRVTHEQFTGRGTPEVRCACFVTIGRRGADSNTRRTTSRPTAARVRNEAPRKAHKAVRTGTKRKRRVSDNSQFINSIGVCERDSRNSGRCRNGARQKQRPAFLSLVGTPVENKTPSNPEGLDKVLNIRNRTSVRAGYFLGYYPAAGLLC